MTRRREAGSGERVRLERGRLLDLSAESAVRAEARGALVSIPTESERVEDGGVAFVVRVVAGPARKQPSAAADGRSGDNPFLPYDEDLFVADVSNTHVCLLNKFKVIDHHLLLVTRRFEEQQGTLTAADFAALWTCMGEFDALGFYNAGPLAGASQRHKHLQLVPVPLGFGQERMPIEPWLTSARFRGALGEAASLPFVHAIARIGACTQLPLARAAATLRATYLELLEAVTRGAQPPPYNLLVTRDWMLLVPRKSDVYRGIPVNALGFAGSLLVRHRTQLEQLRDLGPMRVLRGVGVASGAAA